MKILHNYMHWHNEQGCTGESLAWFMNGTIIANHGSWISKFHFPETQKKVSKVLFLTTCSYTRKNYNLKEKLCREVCGVSLSLLFLL